MRALVGVDGSAAGYAAVQLIGRLLSEGKDEVMLLYSPPGNGARSRAAPQSRLAPIQLRLSEAVFDRARQELPEPLRTGLKTTVSPDDPRQSLLLSASDRCCDLIVVGSRGTDPVSELSLGSVARHVAECATIPVLIVRSTLAPSTEPLRVLLASDGTQTSRRASKILENFSWPPKTVGLAITVIESTMQHNLPEWLMEQLDEEQLAALGMGRFQEDAQQEARRRCEAAKWYGELPTIFADRASLVASGHAGQQILAAINAHGIDLAVVGARRRGPIRRRLLGSTSSYVLNHAPCSVLLVRGVADALISRIESTAVSINLKDI